LANHRRGPDPIATRDLKATLPAQALVEHAMHAFKYSRSLSVFAVVTLVVVGSCAKHSGPVPADDEKKTVVISAAASTKDLIEELAKQFRATADTDVKVNAGPSNALAGQILAGAPADLFLSANQQWADEIDKSGKAAEMVRLLTNQLVLVVPQANPGEVHEPKDLLSERVKKIALAGEKVPAGMYAEQALTKLELLEPLIETQKIVRGQDVRSALSFVERGEAEAGIVYSTDVRIAKGISTAHEFDASLHDEIVYVLVLLKKENGKGMTRKFYEFLQSPDADSTYSQFGFLRLR
jgi:molybdate transport system substrate-binding protein